MYKWQMAGGTGFVLASIDAGQERNTYAAYTEKTPSDWLRFNTKRMYLEEADICSIAIHDIVDWFEQTFIPGK
jgi:hypothetical protein